MVLVKDAAARIKPPGGERQLLVHRNVAQDDMVNHVLTIAKDLAEVAAVVTRSRYAILTGGDAAQDGASMRRHKKHRDDDDEQQGYGGDHEPDLLSPPSCESFALAELLHRVVEQIDRQLEFLQNLDDLFAVEAAPPLVLALKG